MSAEGTRQCPDDSGRSEPLQAHLREYRRRYTQKQEEAKGIRASYRLRWKCFIILTAATILALCAAFVSHSPVSYFCFAAALTACGWVTRSLKVTSEQHSRTQRIIDYYELGIARCSGTGWQGRGISGDEYRPEHHIYAGDVDLFGKGSLFELICTAQSAVGRATLANWLLSPADPTEVLERQGAVADLRTRLDLQEDCVSLGCRSYRNIDVASLRDWAVAPKVYIRPWERVIAMALPVLVLVLGTALMLGALSGNQRWVLLPAIVGLGTTAALLRARVQRMTDGVRWLSHDLSMLGPVIERFGREQFASPRLRMIQRDLAQVGTIPDASIRALRRLTWLLGLRDISEWFALAVSPLLYATNLGICIERWRHNHRSALPVWLDSVGQIEALLCLARYCYENPNHTFPLMVDDGTAMFRAHRLGHPLIASERCVRCDLELDGEDTQVIILSGSNMGGKSTLLRAIGVNVVLAFAGAPVRAERLELSRIQLSCSISVHDSLLDGKSRFQSEVERLRWILEIAKESPTLFLLDEVLGGTNTEDRLYGAKAIVRQLIESRSVGLVTTHDLAVTKIAAEFPDYAVNMHFEEQFFRGRMRFDYLLRPGVLRSTNGRNIMAALGLISN
jgi:hypothetical protein